jgi:hypothetical protein
MFPFIDSVLGHFELFTSPAGGTAAKGLGGARIKPYKAGGVVGIPE